MENLEINLDILVKEEYDWSFGSAKIKILLPIDHIDSFSFDRTIHNLIDEAYADYVKNKLENENTEGDTSSADEE